MPKRERIAELPKAPPVKKGLTREAAVSWFHDHGYTTITELQLRKWAAAGKGPARSRLGKFVYYRPEDLAAWLQEELKPEVKGRTPPRQQ